MEFYIQRHACLPSTNTRLKERLGREPALRSGTVIVAQKQSAGRGRRGRRWLSGTGENLTFSVLVRGAFEPRTLPAAAMAAAVAVAELLQAEQIPAVLKWPNDVLVNGRKICGILSEGVPGGVIIGIGLNVNMQTAEHIDQPATSVRMETGERRDIDCLLGNLLARLGGMLERWKQGGFSGIRDKWEAIVPTPGKPVTVRDGGTERTGRLEGFGPAGELLLRLDSGELLPVWAGDVTQ